MRIYNTLTKRVEPFEPLHPGEARMYTCGPTVYNYAHIGNFRSYVFADLLRTALEFSGLRVVQVMNITDIDDKTIAGANAEGIPLKEFTARYTKAFFEDLAKLRISPPEFTPAATDHIPEMLELVRTLEEKGFAYRSEGSVYFAVDRFPGYGRLSGMRLERNIDGARVDSDEYAKSSAKDFVLWKARKEGEPYWDSPFGPGRPGWHIECSAMSMKYLGPTLDLHTGGADLVFPHHENEIAQSEAATGVSPFVRYWVHCAYLIVEGEKMSKSKGNFYTLRDILDRGHAAEAVRLVLLSTHYRKNLDFTFEALEQAAKTVERFRQFRSAVLQAAPAPGSDPETTARLREHERRFREELCDDLNISGSLAQVFEFMADYNRSYHDRPPPADVRQACLEGLATFDRVLRIPDAAPNGLPEEEVRRIEEAIRRRQEARQRKDYAEADRIRAELAARGIILEDTRDGVKWRKAGA